MGSLEVLAHEGGWDEILMVGGPVLLFAGLLLLARKRARDLNEARDDATATPGDAGTGAGDPRTAGDR